MIEPTIELIQAKVQIDRDLYELFRNERPTFVAYRLKKLTGERAGAAYECRQYRDGRWSCDCKDFQCRRRRCRHLYVLQWLGAFAHVEQGVTDAAE